MYNDAHIYAGFWIRFIAVLIDLAVLTPVIFIIERTASTIGRAAEFEGYSLIAAGLSIFVGFLYFTVMHASRHQATIGKKLMGIQVVDYYKNRLTLVRSFFRQFAALLLALFPVTFLSVMIHGQKRAIYDSFLDTCVVHKRKIGQKK